MGVVIMSWLVAIPLLGFATGLRTMTAIAALCWYAYLGHLPVQGTWVFWTGKLASVAIFSLLAVGEYAGDKLSRTPNRTAPGPLSARLVAGGLVGAIAATAIRGPGIEGVLLGVLGAAAGAFGGFMIRRGLVHKIGCADWTVAVAEDLFAVLCALFAIHVLTN